jgi:hypothetical protein
MKRYVGMEVLIHVQVIITSAVGGDEWSASRPDGFTPMGRGLSTHWI